MGNWKPKKGIHLLPSSADRWTTCTASPGFIFANWEKLPPEDRTFADPGNTAHEVAAALLQNRKVNLTDCPVPVEPEMNWHGWNYMEFVNDQLAPGGKLFVEQRLPLFFNESRNAVVDAAAINPDNLHIVDYKYGEGIIVSPVENLQATIYAKSVVFNWHKFGVGREKGDGLFVGRVFDKPDNFPIHVTIYQPRTRDGEPYHTWETTWGEIRERAHQIQLIAQRIYKAHNTGETLDFKPSEKACQWCPAKGFCHARQEELVKDLEPLAVIDGRELPAGRALNEKQLAAIVRHGAQIKKFIDDAQQFALQHMRNGGKIPGFKLVKTKGGKRYWSDAPKVAKYLLEDTILRKEEVFSEPSLKSPKQIEDMLGKGKFPKRVFNLIAKPPGQSIIAPEDDPRDSALIDASAEFVDLDAIPSTSTNLDDF